MMAMSREVRAALARSIINARIDAACDPWDAWNRYQGRRERSAQLQAEGWSERTAEQAAKSENSDGAALVESIEEMQDPYNFGLRFFKSRRNGRRKNRRKSIYGWYYHGQPA